MDTTTDIPWYADHANLHLVADYLVRDGADADELLDLIAKPWHYEDEYAKALREARTL